MGIEDAIRTIGSQAVALPMSDIIAAFIHLPKQIEDEILALNLEELGEYLDYEPELFRQEMAGILAPVDRQAVVIRLQLLALARVRQQYSKSIFTAKRYVQANPGCDCEVCTERRKSGGDLNDSHH